MHTLTPKAKASVLQQYLDNQGFVLSRGRALEVVAKMEGYANYRTLHGAQAAKPVVDDGERVFGLPFGIEIRCNPGAGGSLDSELVEEFSKCGYGKEADAMAKASANAIESLLLALACAGVDLSTPAISSAIEVAVEKVASEL